MKSIIFLAGVLAIFTASLNAEVTGKELELFFNHKSSSTSPDRSPDEILWLEPVFVSTAPANCVIMENINYEVFYKEEADKMAPHFACTKWQYFGYRIQQGLRKKDGVMIGREVK